MDTLKSLVDGLSAQEKMDCLIVVFIAEVGIGSGKMTGMKTKQKPIMFVKTAIQG